MTSGGQYPTNLITRLLDELAHLSGRLLLALIGVQFAIVLLRYLIAANYLWLQELAVYLHAAIFMLGAATALRHNRHIRIDIVSQRLDAATNRKIELLGTWILLVPTMLVILWLSFDYVWQSWSILEGSAELSGLPGVFLLKSLIPLFAILMLLAGFARLRASDRNLRQ